MGTTEIDTTARQVRIAGCEVVLSPKEYDLLMLFVRNPHRAFSREDIYERVWHGYYPSKSKAVDIAVARLRKKMGWDAEIKAIRKFGYRFDPPSMGYSVIFPAITSPFPCAIIVIHECELLPVC